MSVTAGTSGAVAYSAQNGTSVAPAYPSGIAAGNLLVLTIGMKPSTANGGTVTTPAGWTLVHGYTGQGGYGTTLAADSGNTNLFIFVKEAAGTETGSLTVTVGTNNVCWAVITRYSYDQATGQGWATMQAAQGSRATTPTSPMTITATEVSAGSFSYAAGDMLHWAFCIPTDVTTPSQFSAESITGTGATFGTSVEIAEPDSGTGNDIGGVVGYTPVSGGSGSTSVNWVTTLAGTLTNVRGPLVVLRIREDPFVLNPYDEAPATYVGSSSTPGGPGGEGFVSLPAGSVVDDVAVVWAYGNGLDNPPPGMTVDASGTAYGVAWKRLSAADISAGQVQGFASGASGAPTNDLHVFTNMRDQRPVGFGGGGSGGTQLVVNPTHQATVLVTSANGDALSGVPNLATRAEKVDYTTSGTKTITLTGTQGDWKSVILYGKATGPAVPDAVIWNGTSWVGGVAWDGDSWVTPKVWNGTRWVPVAAP